ncbi:ABC transporter ATP-binding protein [Agrobacterium genomosp. 3]|uniref:ABC transporter ATP-binding protein n=1 Tax=Agrobacterium tomkonis TaxID=1183410 RepID=UPI001CD8E4E7|nr:ABC transporter ATP-binding protein [Agrobacterium tomkonis]MCA1879259.1 ABC transporter ATP-binding protein [Agrobacterium tumefaciens]MCA1894422.1 ABC transporter ATP-binding protein [Agrobacterium tomkonis]
MEQSKRTDPGHVLDVKSLTVGVGGVNIVAGLDLSLQPGELACMVGESGSGKSLTALSLMGLLGPGLTSRAERISFLGQDITNASEADMQALRGNRMAMVFQEPMTSLNPVMRVGDQLIEPLIRHRGMSRKAAWALAEEMLRKVQIPAASERMSVFPHQLSGGMRQRVMIAMALVCRPALLVADEPTTALDVTIQGQVLQLIDELRAELGTATLFVTHNLAVVAEIADVVYVMYAGRVVERASKRDLFNNPMHPYTLALFAAIPRSSDAGQPLVAISGQVPAAADMPSGCRFAPRCPFATDRCGVEQPPLREIEPGHFAACWNAPIEGHASD